MEIYCNQLGMVIALSYCLTVNSGLPCRNTIGCWKRRTDISAVLRERFTEDELMEAFGGPPKSKIDRILDAMLRAEGHPRRN